MKKNLTEIIILALLVIPFAAALIFWDDLPSQMAIHFNFKGEADIYGSKVVGLLMLPLVNILIYTILKFLPAIFINKGQFGLFAKRLSIIRLVVHCFITALYIAVLLYTLNHQSNILLFIAYGILMVLLITGNYLNNIKPNYFMGIRTPWTLQNAEVWRKTHHLTSRLWVTASLLMMCIIPFVPQVQVSVLLLVYFIIIAIPPFVYSYIIYKKQSPTKS
jgi:uncharacterized membrane protein